MWKKKKREKTSNSSLAHKSQSTDSRTPGLAKLVHIQNPLGQGIIEKYPFFFKEKIHQMIYSSPDKTAHTQKKVEKELQTSTVKYIPKVLSASKKSKKSGTGHFHPINPRTKISENSTETRVFDSKSLFIWPWLWETVIILRLSIYPRFLNI